MQVLPYFMPHEDHYGGASTSPRDVNADFKRLHGSKQATAPRQHGRMAGGKQRLRWDVLDAFAHAAVQAGIPATDDFNRGNNEGVGYFEVNQKKGWRWNTAKAFLRPTCYGATNFEMWTAARRPRAWRWSATPTAPCAAPACRPGRAARCRPHAWRRAASAAVRRRIGSPQMLQLSGIGPASCCSAARHPVVHDLPGRGRQPAGPPADPQRVQGAGRQDAQHPGQLAGGARPRSAWSTLLSRSGPMSMAPSQLGAFTRSVTGQPWPNIEYHVQPLSLDAFGEPLHRFAAITASVCNLNPSSRGTVHIRRAPLQDAPAIAPNYLSTPEDRQVAADSLRVTRRIVAQPAWRATSPRNTSPARSTRAMRSWRAWPATLPPPSSTRWAPPRWGATTTRWRCSTHCRCDGARPDPACAWSMPAPCPPSPAATPIQPNADDGREGGALDRAARG
jgi:choline dehydrogenase